VFRVGGAAELLGVSVDTVRRWVDAGRLAATRDAHGHRVVDGVDLAEFVRSKAAEPDIGSEDSSARNRLRGIVTAVVKDTVMAQVDIQADPFRVVSLMSREAVEELDLKVGSVAVAVIKSTNVVVERSTLGAARGRSTCVAAGFAPAWPRSRHSPSWRRAAAATPRARSPRTGR